MGTVTLRNTVEKVGDASISTVEYTFSDTKDFFQWEASKHDAVNEAVKSIVGGGLFGGAYPDDNSFGEESVEKESAVVDINVGKKETKH